MRHAPGATARVELRGGPETLVLDISNDVSNDLSGDVSNDSSDGIAARDGADRPTAVVAVPAGAGHGIVGMRERAELLDGELRVDSSVGFRVAVVLPLAAPPDAALAAPPDAPPDIAPEDARLLDDGPTP